MNQKFEANEKLYRAVYPPAIAKMFWKENGTLSSAAFADKRGLSVDRGYGRNDDAVVEDILKRLHGYIISVLVGQCWDVEAEVCYLPSKNNKYHSEIHGSKDSKLLSKQQRRYLALSAQLVYAQG